MSSESYSIQDGNRNVNITINHYHNHEIQQNPFNNFMNNILTFGLMQQMFLPQQDMSGKVIEDIKKLANNGNEKKLISNFNIDEIQDVEYEVHEERIDEINIAGISTTEKEKIPIVYINTKDNGKIVTSCMYFANELREKIKYKLSNLGGLRTNIFMCYFKRDIINGSQIRVLFTENNLCENILSKYDKNSKGFVVFKAEIGQKLGINFYELLENRGIDILVELNKIYTIELLKTNYSTKYKVKYVQDIK